MITATLALITMATQDGQAAQLNAGDILTSVIKKYQEAETFTASVTMTQTVADAKRVVTTNLQAQRPSKLFLTQEWLDPKPKEKSKWTVVSDGVNWRYDAPQDGKFIDTAPLVEPVAVVESGSGDKRMLKLNDFLIGARRSLGDQVNPYLEFLMQGQGEGNAKSLRVFLNRLQKLSAVPRKLKDGTEGYAVKGIIQWGILAAGQVKNIGVSEDFDRPARFEMQLTKDYDIRRIQTVETVRIVPEGSNVPTDLNISTIWEGEVKLNAQPNQSLFNVR